MKIQITNEFLQSAVHRISGVIQERTMGHIFLNAQSNKLQVVASDMIFLVNSLYECEIMAAGSCFVASKSFADIVKELPTGLVKLEVTTNFLQITAGQKGQFEMKLPLMEQQEMIHLPNVDISSHVKITANSINYLIDQVQFSISNNSTRNFGAVGYLHNTKQDHIRLVGSDGFRLSYCELTDAALPKNFLKEGICLSKRSLLEIARMCQEGFAEVNLALSNDLTIFLASVPDYSIYMRLSSVNYPPYEKVIPQKTNDGIKLSRSYFMGVIRRILLAADKLNVVHFNIENSQLLLSSRNGNNSESKEVVHLEFNQKEAISLAVNGRYLLEVLSSIKSEMVNIFFTNAETPVIITPQEEPQGCHSMHILVPIEDSAQNY